MPVFVARENERNERLGFHDGTPPQSVGAVLHSEAGDPFISPGIALQHQSRDLFVDQQINLQPLGMRLIRSSWTPELVAGQKSVLRPRLSVQERRGCHLADGRFHLQPILTAAQAAEADLVVGASARTRIAAPIAFFGARWLATDIIRWRVRVGGSAFHVGHLMGGAE